MNGLNLLTQVAKIALKFHIKYWLLMFGSGDAVFYHPTFVKIIFLQIVFGVIIFQNYQISAQLDGCHF